MFVKWFCTYSCHPRLTQPGSPAPLGTPQGPLWTCPCLSPNTSSALCSAYLLEYTSFHDLREKQSENVNSYYKVNAPAALLYILIIPSFLLLRGCSLVCIAQSVYPCTCWRTVWLCPTVRLTHEAAVLFAESCSSYRKSLKRERNSLNKAVLSK